MAQKDQQSKSVMQRKIATALHSAGQYYQWVGAKRAVLAVVLYRDAAKLCNPAAMYSLARCYHEGIGIKKNGVQARRWLKHAVSAGDPYAQYVLGMRIRNGVGGEVKNPRAGFRMLLEAAKEGQTDAQFSVGVCYSRGEGTSRSFESAAEWYAQAAAAGHSDALFNLGFYFENGRGIPKDEKLAEILPKSCCGGRFGRATESRKHVRRRTRREKKPRESCISVSIGGQVRSCVCDVQFSARTDREFPDKTLARRGEALAQKCGRTWTSESQSRTKASNEK